MPDTNSPIEQALGPILTWTAPVHPTHERTARWYLIGSLIVVGLAAYSIITGAWSLALVSILTGALYFLVRDHSFPDATIIIDNAGIRIGDAGLPWDSIAGFWLLPTPRYMELHVVPKEKRVKELTIQTATVDIATIRQALEGRILELTDKHERLLDAFIRICKL